MHISISGKGIDLTPAIEEYVHKKIGGLDKFYDKVQRAHVLVGVDNHHHLAGEIFVAECKLEVPGKDIFGAKHEKDLYAAIDTLQAFLQEELKAHKRKHEEVDRRDQKAVRDSKEFAPEE